MQSDPSLSQSLAASASDLKRPSSASSSISDSQTLSRTRQAKAHYGRAARAFLQRDHLAALLESQYAANILSASTNLGLSLSSANLAEADAELGRTIEKLVILRFTAISSTLSDDTLRKNLLSQLSQRQKSSEDPTSTSPTSPSQACQQLSALLSREPVKLISYLWFEALQLCAQASTDTDTPTLEPSTETLLLAAELPASVISAAILASLRLNDLDHRNPVGTQSARLIAEWYLAAYSSAVGPHGPTEKTYAAYEKVVNLYALHILATRLDEWEYAREFVGYSSLEEPKKLALLSQLDVAHAHVLAKPDRVFEAEAAAQKAYEAEKAKRAEAEKEAKAKSASGGKLNDIAKGVTDLLRGDNAAEGDAFARMKSSSSRMKAGASNGYASSGSESGSARNARSGYFSPRGSGSSSSAASPQVSSPGSSRSVPVQSETSFKQDKKLASTRPQPRRDGSRSRSEERIGAARSSNGTDGEASDGASTSSRSRSRDEPTAGSGRDKAKASSIDKDDSSYASTRAHLSRYVTNNKGARPARGTVRSGSRNGAPSVAPVASLLEMLKSFFDLRNAQSRSYLLSTIVLLFVFYRFLRRPSKGTAMTTTSGTTTGHGARRKESAAARDARNRLVQRGQGSSAAWGLGPMLLVWNKVVDTVKMGTQVTYM